MNRPKRIIFAGLLSLATGAGYGCLGPGATSSELKDRPEWANGTDWRGTVTMKSGVSLAVSFHLETKLGTGYDNSRLWVIIPSPARIENALTGAGGFTAGSGIGEFINLDFFTRDAPIDGSAGCVETDGWRLWYNLYVMRTDDNSLKGNLMVSCVGPDPSVPSVPIDSQPTVVRRVLSTQ
jgi:hypothetical protein